MSHSATLSNRRCASIRNPNNLNSTSARPVAESALGAHPSTVVDSPTVGPSPLATNPYSSLIRLGGCSYDAGSSTSPPLHPPLQNCTVPMPQAAQVSVYSDSELTSRCYGTDPMRSLVPSNRATLARPDQSLTTTILLLLLSQIG
jgi:hypothetical protein